MSNGWIGVDFDGTLAVYHGFQGVTHTGAPVPSMVHRVKVLLAQGEDVRLFTARAFNYRRDPAVRLAIDSWMNENLGVVLPVTDVKDHEMKYYLDDKAVGVEFNTGRLKSPIPQESL